MSAIDGIEADPVSSSNSINAVKAGKRVSDNDQLSPTHSLNSKVRRTESKDVNDNIPFEISIGGRSSDISQNHNTIGIQKPIQITSFSYDEKRNLFHDDRSKKFYHPPLQNVNLNRGYETKIDRDESKNEHLDSLLEAIMKVEEEGRGQQKQTDLITWRGMMTKLCTILYEDQQGFEMNVMMVDGTLYVEENIGKSKIAERKRMKEGSERSKRNGYHGYSFESYTCHSWRDWGPESNVWDGDVNTNVQWCSVVKTKLGDFRLILGGEVDAIDPNSFAPIEIKVTGEIKSAKDEEFFEKKMLRFYMQSFLLGIQKIIVGFRDRQGFLVTFQEMDTLAMPRAVRGKPHAWDPIACLKGASDILFAVKTHVSANVPKNQWPPLKEAEKSDSFPVFRLTYLPSRLNEKGKQLSLTKLTKEQILHEIKGGKEEGMVGFLTSKYYQHLRKGHVQ